MYQTSLRRHLDPRCTCPACLAFDQSTTRPMQRLTPHAEQVNAFDTETGARFMYYFPSEASYSAPRSMPEPLQLSAAPRRHDHCVTPHREQTLHALLVPTILQKLQGSIEAHPCLWLGISCVLSCLRIL